VSDVNLTAIGNELFDRLPADARVSFVELGDYRLNGKEMAEVWPLVGDYTPDDQRAEARRILCNAILDLCGKKTPSP
jgi:hypothetical protein